MEFQEDITQDQKDAIDYREWEKQEEMEAYCRLCEEIENYRFISLEA